MAAAGHRVGCKFRALGSSKDTLNNGVGNVDAFESPSVYARPAMRVPVIYKGLGHITHQVRLAQLNVDDHVGDVVGLHAPGRGFDFKVYDWVYHHVPYTLIDSF